MTSAIAAESDCTGGSVDPSRWNFTKDDVDQLWRDIEERRAAKAKAA